jgi:PHD/YefM family antitoxin component YafN of YafNO toxin-antitoxin module
MDKTAIKETIKKYKEKEKEFRPYLESIEDALRGYEKMMETTGEHISSGMAERIKEIRKGFDKFSEMNQRIESFKDNL